MLKIALAGNPNCGKTTLFNLLTASKEYVGNRAGVTVGKKERPLKWNDGVIIVDLPGVYSLSPFSPEEIAARSFLLDEKPDVIINLLDASNLRRGLYLTTELLETGTPVVLALNMADKLEKTGAKINAEALGAFFNAPALFVCTARNENVRELVQAAVDAVSTLPGSINLYPNAEIPNDDETMEQYVLSRYNLVDEAISFCLTAGKDRQDISLKIDKIVLNRFLAFPILFVVIFLIYFVCVSLAGSAVSAVAARLPITDIVSARTQEILGAIGCAEWLQMLVTDGIITAVGSVLEFVPQVFMLFLALGFLEESGYMARVAFLTDRIFKVAGLSGKAFIPLLIGSGCSVPAIMSTRTIESDKMRRMSIIVTSFIPCSAKLTVIVFIASAVFGGTKYAPTLAFIFAVAAVFLSGILLKDSKMFRGGYAPFLMEMPTYAFVPLRGIAKNAARQSMAFVKKAGTVILLSSAAVWFLSYFSIEGGFHAAENFESGILGSVGSLLASFFAPLGFGSGEMSVAVISGFFAKENIVGTLEVLLGKSGIALLGQSITPAAALSFLTFNLLCPPCIVAVNTIRREMNSAKWTAFALFYQTVFAYGMAFLVYQLACAAGNIIR